MKITIRNFGPIKKYEADLSKMLIVNYGINNIGKSCAMNVTYLLIKNLTYIFSAFPLLMISPEEFNEHSIFRDMREYFYATFGKGNMSNKYSGKPLEILLASESPYFRELFTERDGELCLESAEYNLRQSDTLRNDAIAFLGDCFGSMRNHFIPASRLGLYQGFISALGPTIAEISKIRGSLQNPYIRMPHLTAPAADYISSFSYENPTIYDEESLRKQKQIASDIEQDVLNGIIRFDREQQSFFFRPNGLSSEIPVEYASSMVGELAPLVRFIREMPFPLFGKETLFYEEPEAHLHPEKQAIIAEKLVCLSECKLKQIISTHSNYMFNKFNNLSAEWTTVLL